MILNRKDLREAIFTSVGGGILIAIAFWLRGLIEAYMGETAASWLLNIFLLVYLLSLIPVLSGWLEIRNWERMERKQKRTSASGLKWRGRQDSSRMNMILPELGSVKPTDGQPSDVHRRRGAD
ncbi:hypothetical protein [Bradyrhizobium sp. CCGB20]|uniref:hypothetical protein n=1 Tax=Bradyrhizobium sp. CCGB20 TaxID=2949633 RepID=UPI0020B40FE8|nr:hypothetical protein [Bradyrhizobium sp. CCGB20]MCP3402151.1 hypothetical protein [Bradyrhizobium sp. CCGB20]